MKKIKVTLNVEIDVDVYVDETVIDKETLDVIAEHFDEDIYDSPDSCEEELNDYERGLYNYAQAAALKASGIGEVEYIDFDKGHTKAKETGRWLESSFERALTVPSVKE